MLTGSEIANETPCDFDCENATMNWRTRMNCSNLTHCSPSPIVGVF